MRRLTASHPATRMQASRVVLLPLLLSLMTACAPTSSPRSERAAAADAMERYSIYDLDTPWRDQGGRARTLATLRGRPRALAMVYTHCAAACPITIAEIRRIAAQTPPAVGLVLVSLDPDRDTPGRLAEWAAGLGLDSARWTLLTGDDDAVRELAATIGVRYRRMSAADIAHSNVITLLDASGVVRHQQAGADGTDETIRVARTLAR